MSNFFRSGNSTSSSESDQSTSGEEDDGEVTQEAALQSLEPGHLSTSSTTSTSVPSLPNQHRDFLLHALLEERCVNEVLASYSGQPPRRDAPEVQAEAGRRYHRLCERLASYNLISTGLEEDKHAVTRQRYRDGLDLLGRPQMSSSSAVAPAMRRLLTGQDTQLGDLQIVPAHPILARVPAFEPFDQPIIPHPLRRLLTAPGYYSGYPHDMDNQTLRRALPPGRFYQEFDQIGTIGSGGYGIVYKVKHRLDGRNYAVKKVPLSQARIDRIRERGHNELDEVLKEIRTLARLDHPNIVRYFTGWVEWVDVAASNRYAQAAIIAQQGDAVPGAAINDDVAARRVITESSIDGTEVVFENSKSRSSIHSKQESTPRNIAGTGRLQRIRTTSSASDNLSKALDETHIGSSCDSEDKVLSRVGTKSTIATVSDDTEEFVDRTLDPSFSMHSSTGIINFKESTFALHMQMSLHPMTLEDYLAPRASAESGPSHCFHLGPSITILLAVLDGLAYLHKEGIVHRDIKPGNIFLGSANKIGGALPCENCWSRKSKAPPPSLEVRIGDFGLVSLAEPDASSSSTSQHAHSVGTKTYLPLKPVVGAALDIYALAIVTFELSYQFGSMAERGEKISQLKLGHFPRDFCCDEDAAAKRGELREAIVGMLAAEHQTLSVDEVKGLLVSLDLTPGSGDRDDDSEEERVGGIGLRTHEWRPTTGSFRDVGDSD